MKNCASESPSGTYEVPAVKVLKKANNTQTQTQELPWFSYAPTSTVDTTNLHYINNGWNKISYQTFKFKARWKTREDKNKKTRKNSYLFLFYTLFHSMFSHSNSLSGIQLFCSMLTLSLEWYPAHIWSGILNGILSCLQSKFMSETFLIYPRKRALPVGK